MKKLFLITLISFFNIFLISTAIAQEDLNVTEEQVLQELNKRGLSEEEVREALIENGFDPDDLENATPEQILQIQQIIEDLEKRKAEEQLSGDQEKDDSESTDEETDETKDEELEITPDTIAMEEPELEIYGHSILKLPVKKSMDNININENYILGQGDKISISIWSNTSQFENTFTIDKNGYIKLNYSDLKRRIFLKGLTFSNAREKIKNVFSRYMMFKKDEFNIDIVTSRMINISVYGEVLNPGSFNIDATNTAFEGIRYSAGVTEIASVRNVMVIKPSGDSKSFDIYKYLMNPKYVFDFFLDDNDMVYVPVAEKIVEISGGVNRPMSYELLKGEGLKELMEYCGGFSKDAIKTDIQIERFVDNKKQFITIDYLDENGRISDMELENGDIITINKITTEPDNFFEITGRVYNPGTFERKPGMKISNAVEVGGLLPDSKTDFAFLLRTDEYGVRSYIDINIDEILKNTNNPAIDLLLNNEDKIIIWSKKRFTDISTFEVSGSVRDERIYDYGPSQSVKISEAITLAGGLKSDASNIAIIHRQDPLKKYEKQYIRVDLEKVLNNENSSDNITLEPFDKLEILSDSYFNEYMTVSINGAVNNPGEFQYGKGMTLKDLIILAGSFKISASTNNIEISRVIIKNNEPLKIVIAKVDLDKDILNFENDDNSFVLEPYDNVNVRYVPEFELQKVITIEGEVKLPGNYTLISKNEKISDIIERAGGLTEEAFNDGATLNRTENKTGFIVMNLDEALKNYRSKYNYVLKDGDLITVPKTRDFVTITGATKVHEKYKENKNFNSSRGINVPYHKGKRAMFYIDKYAGGIDENGDKKEILVEHPNREIEKTVDYVLVQVSPKVSKGSIIIVGEKKKKTEEEKKKEDVDWNKIIGDSVAQISLLMTLVVLFRSISN